ncbi:MAG: cation:proton antiporter regulatory subunit [Thermoleophilia bacterium]
MKAFRETVLPGVGKKYSFLTEGGDLVVIIVHDEGRREIHHFVGPDADGPRDMLVLTDFEADRLASILGGAFYRPALAERMEMALEGVHIEWVVVEQDSVLSGRAIGELELRKKTGVSVVAVIRDEQPLVNPGPELVFQAADVLVLVGRADCFASFRRLVEGEET